MLHAFVIWPGQTAGLSWPCLSGWEFQVHVLPPGGRLPVQPCRTGKLHWTGLQHAVHCEPQFILMALCTCCLHVCARCLGCWVDVGHTASAFVKSKHLGLQDGML